jgi:hypothetical protein
MVGFAVVGPAWKPGQASYNYDKFRALSFILMVGRFVLIGQYATTLYFTWKFRSARLPVIMVIVSYLIAGILYGALSAAFPENSDVEMKTSNVYIAWYVIAVGETLLTTAVSCKWRVISFKGTHLVQRMSLLTLIILGEGIIVICKAISYIVKNDYIFTSSVIGQIISAVLIIYFLYMLYFDRLTEDHFGTIKQQIWAFLHFPLHIVLVLVLEGVSNFVTWRQAVVGLEALGSGLDVAYANITNPEGAIAQNTSMVIDYLQEVAWAEVFAYVPKGIDSTTSQETVTQLIDDIYNELSSNQTVTQSGGKLDTSFAEYSLALINMLLESLAIKAPDKKKDDGSTIDPAVATQALLEVFDLVFVYFFVTVSAYSSPHYHTCPTSPVHDANNLITGWSHYDRHGYPRLPLREAKDYRRLHPQRHLFRSRACAMLVVGHEVHRCRGSIRLLSLGPAYALPKLVRCYCHQLH